MLQRVRKGIMFHHNKQTWAIDQSECHPPQRFGEEFCQLRERKMEKVRYVQKSTHWRKWQKWRLIAKISLFRQNCQSPMVWDIYRYYRQPSGDFCQNRQNRQLPRGHFWHPIQIARGWRFFASSAIACISGHKWRKWKENAKQTGICMMLRLLKWVRLENS